MSEPRFTYFPFVYICIGKEGVRRFLGSKIFNKLPNNMKTESSIVKFKTACKDFPLDLILFKFVNLYMI